MPTKTRKQKIRAEKRRKLQITQLSTSVKSPYIFSPPVQDRANNENRVYDKRSHDTTQLDRRFRDSQVVKKDLLRVGIFALFAFSLQIVVYWLLRRG